MGVFDSQQLIPASSGFDHTSSQKDKNHFPAIQVRIKAANATESKHLLH